MVDVDEAAHAVRHQDLMHRLVGDSIQPHQQGFAPGAALVGAQAHVAPGAQDHERGSRGDPLGFDSKVVHRGDGPGDSSFERRPLIPAPPPPP